MWHIFDLGFPIFIKDIDCAFKLINKRVIDSVGELQTDGAMTTTEFLLKAYKQGYSFKQVGVTHLKRKYGAPTGDSLKVIKKAVIETFRLKRALVYGVFSKPISVRPIALDKRATIGYNLSRKVS